MNEEQIKAVDAYINSPLAGRVHWVCRRCGGITGHQKVWCKRCSGAYELLPTGTTLLQAVRIFEERELRDFPGHTSPEFVVAVMWREVIKPLGIENQEAIEHIRLRVRESGSTR